MEPLARQNLFDNFDSAFYMAGQRDRVKPEKSFVSDWLFELFSKGDITGDTILDIGTGPDINTVLYACPYFKKIYLSDYSRNNRKYLEEWVQGQHDDAVGYYIEGALTREGSTLTFDEKQRELRSKIADILYCDVTQKNPIGTNPKYSNAQFDAVITAWCLNSAVNSEEEYFDALQNIISLIKPGGHFVLMEVCTNYGKYDVNGVEYPCVIPTDERVKAFFDESYKPITTFVELNVSRGDKIKLHYFNIAVQIPK